MVIRYLCKCATCGHPHTLRISVGHESCQEHTLRCGSCGEEMVVAMQLDSGDASVNVTCISNCEPGNEEGLVVNLHPNFTIPEDQLHQDQAFPWLENVQAITKEQEKILGGFPGFGSLEELREFALSIQTTLDGWQKIKKAWSLILNGQDDLAKVRLESYQDHDFTDPHELNYVLFHFGKTLLKPRKAKIFLEANSLAAEISQKYQPEYVRFREYYLNALRDEHLQRYFDIFSEYFRDFSEFNQTLLFSQYALPLPEEAQASSSAFKRTKMLYGNAFEALTSNATLLGCLNNIGQGRAYDQFETMDLSKYLTINKANRSNVFKDAKPFFEFAKTLDSTLRNSSHHGAMNIDRSGKVISYRSGGTGALRRMPYAAYLHYCNELFLRLVALLMLELVIAF